MGAVDPISILIVMGLTWWTVKRSWGGYNLLVSWIIGYTATALWRLDGWHDIALVVAIGLAQIACLRHQARRTWSDAAVQGRQTQAGELRRTARESFTVRVQAIT